MKLVQTVVLAVAGLFIAVGLLLFLYEQPQEAFISITFDDGYSSQYIAAEKLEEYGYKGTFYIQTDSVGKEFENISIMTWDQIKDLRAKGNEIGGHGAGHLKAGDVSSDIYEKDILKSMEIFENNNITVKNFAYPYGDDSKKNITLKYFETARGIKPCINGFDDKEICGLTLVSKNEEYKVLTDYLTGLKVKGGWLILVIHGVDENQRPDVDLKEEEFDWVLQQIKDSKIQVKTIAEIYTKSESPA